ncbi:MAG: hypothetical protein HYX41_04925 [Bdellovibrio sp.]|nr:hypothetical protein [Bdellovibrio sp.]
MDVSNAAMEPDGNELLEVLVSLTGLPQEWIIREIEQILAKTGKTPQEMTLDHLREALMVHLNSVYLEMGQLEPVE